MTILRPLIEAEAFRRLSGGEGIQYYGLDDHYPTWESDMNMNDIKPLQPLQYGNVLIVGAKASNFDDEIKTHPRVILWSSQNEHWQGKNLPDNVRAVFITRWIGHAAFKVIMSEARKKKITIFNPEGTGLIARQVKELLDLQSAPRIVMGANAHKPIEMTEVKVKEKETIVTKVEKKLDPRSKLHALIPFIDYSRTNTQNADALLEGKAKELGITSTRGSLSNFVGKIRGRKPQITARKPDTTTHRVHKYVDVSVQILDNMVKELQDMRDFLVATTEENKNLKSKLEKFRKMIEE